MYSVLAKLMSCCEVEFFRKVLERGQEKTKSQIPKYYSLSEVQWKQSWFYEIGGKSNELQACSLNKSGSGSSFHAPVPLLDHRLKEKKKMRGAKRNDFFPGTSDHFILLY